jgi:hypothetical protein
LLCLHLPEQLARIIVHRSLNTIAHTGINKPTYAWCDTFSNYRPI